ncbi:MAG TPA: hypothetical protein DCE00_02650 [Firmicutes bacterium]|jgi:predicted RNA-binding protein|nr:CooT family nickel-binding protein [Bacillota bacterium]HAA37754.1 hypothetical protein [Bacillota bacterium]
MCLAKVYNEEGAEPLLDSVTSVSVDNDRLIFTTLFGEEQIFTGTIKRIDFSDAQIHITKK